MKTPQRCLAPSNFNLHIFYRALESLCEAFCLVAVPILIHDFAYEKLSRVLACSLGSSQ